GGAVRSGRAPRGKIRALHWLSTLRRMGRPRRRKTRFRLGASSFGALAAKNELTPISATPISDTHRSPRHWLPTRTKSSLPAKKHESYVIIAPLSRQVPLQRVHHLASDRLGTSRSSFTDGRVESVYAKGPVAPVVCIDQSVGVECQHVSWL